MSIPPDTIGYGAVVLPHLDEFQGFFLVQDEDLNKQAVMAQMTALAINPAGIHGGLQASIVDRVLNRDWHGVGVLALALWGITKEPYFYIKATKEAEGTRTQMFVLKAESVHDAQIEINNLPEVLAIKKRLRKAIQKRKQ